MNLAAQDWLMSLFYASVGHCWTFSDIVRPLLEKQCCYRHIVEETILEIGTAFDVLATCLSQLSCYNSIIAIPCLFCHLKGLWLMFTSHLVTSFNPIRYLTRKKPNRETGGTEAGPYGSSTYVPLKCAPPAFQSLSFTQFYLKTTSLIITFNIW